MRPETFLIEIHNKPVLSYFPGEVVQGVVHVTVGPTQPECVCKGIKVSFKGKAEVRWSEQYGNTRVEFHSLEPYFDQKLYLLGTGSSEIVLPPGNYAYPFQCILPQGIPTSFIGAHGKVAYKIEAEMVMGTFQSNHKAKVSFTVNGVVDLNIEPMVGEPVERRKFKHMCCLCCKSGDVGFTLRIPRSGYVSGEFISFIAEFSNQSNRTVKEVSAYLYQKVTFHVKKKTNTTYEIIRKETGPEVKPGETEIWNQNSLQIPPLPPTGLAGGCHIISVEYFLKIEMHLSGVAVNLRHNIPILIGSIPLRSSFQEITRLQTNINGTQTPDIHSPPSYFHDNFNYPNLPPPSYAEAVYHSDAPTHVVVPGGVHNPGFERDTNGPSNTSVPNPNSIPLTTMEETNKFAPKYITYG